MRFHKHLPAEWFAGLVVEQPRTRYVKGRAVREWVKPNGARNEPLDLSVYNLATAYRLGLHKWTALDWQRLRDRLIPPTPDLFAPAIPVAPVVPPLPVAEPLALPEPAPAAVQTSVPQQPGSSAVPVTAPTPERTTPAIHQPAPVGRRILSRGI